MIDFQFPAEFLFWARKLKITRSIFHSDFDDWQLENFSKKKGWALAPRQDCTTPAAEKAPIASIFYFISK